MIEVCWPKRNGNIWLLGIVCYLPHSLGQSTHLDDRWPWTVRVGGWKTKLLDIPNQRVFTVKLLRKFLGIRMYPGSSSDLRLGTRCSLLVHRNISSMKMDVQNMVAAMTKFLGSRNQCQWPIMAPWSWTQATHLSHHCSWTKHVETALNMHTHTHRKLSGKHGFRMHARLCLLSVWWGCLLFPFSAGFLSIIPWGLALWALAPTRMSNGSSLRLRHVSEMFLSCDDKHEKISSRKWAGV